MQCLLQSSEQPIMSKSVFTSKGLMHSNDHIKTKSVHDRGGAPPTPPLGAVIEGRAPLTPHWGIGAVVEGGAPLTLHWGNGSCGRGGSTLTLHWCPHRGESTPSLPPPPSIGGITATCICEALYVCKRGPAPPVAPQWQV